MTFKCFIIIDNLSSINVIDVLQRELYDGGAYGGRFFLLKMSIIFLLHLSTAAIVNDC